LKEESATLKTILKEEFGRAPGEVGTANPTVQQPVFSVDWDGTDSTTTALPPPPKRRKGLGRLLDDDAPKPVITVE
jgi:hypothetical protein